MLNKSTDELIRVYLQHCQIEKGLSLKTIKAYRLDLMQFSYYIRDGLHNCSKAIVQNYLSILQEQYKVKSVKRKIASLKAFFTYLVEEGILDTSPFDNLRIKLHEPFILPKTIPLSTIYLILQSAYNNKDTLKNKSSYQYNICLRDIAVLELLFATGMRVSELCSLSYNSINLKEGAIKIYGKGSKERIIHVSNPDVLAALCAYYTAFSSMIHTHGWFFLNRLGKRLSEQSVRNMVKRYTDQTDIDQHITPHMFRHSFATLLLEEDVDIRYIQQFLGHSSITTTQIYTHVTARKQRDILSTRHPRNRIKL